jgi:hypothetical protein
MDYKESLNQLKAFVREVKEYYDRSKQHTHGTFAVSQQMVAFALPKLTPIQLKAFIKRLEKRGLITIVKKALSFSPDFLAA